jgi:hypothetical protein
MPLGFCAGDDGAVIEADQAFAPLVVCRGASEFS